MTGISINKYLHKILTQDEGLTLLVNPDNIKALITSPTNYPFISFKRNSIEAYYNKDVCYEDQIECDIICVSDNYLESVQIAEYIRTLLEFKQYKDDEDNIIITYMILVDAVEDTINDAFVQTLTFKFHIQEINR